MIKVYVDSIGLIAPGLQGWTDSKAVLTGATAYDGQALPRLLPTYLPPTERRRASTSVRLAVQVAQEALEACARDATDLATVFVSSDGDTEIIHHLCTSLATEEKLISPTRFHNSVHNAPAGYWHIAAGSPASSNSICAWDQSFAVGLMDAAVQVSTEQRSVMLCAYDMVVPEPLNKVRCISIPFATAIILSTQKSAQSLAELHLSLKATDDDDSKVSITELDNLMSKNPIARALPLLSQIAGKETGRVLLESTGSQKLCIEVDRL